MKKTWIFSFLLVFLYFSNYCFSGYPSLQACCKHVLCPSIGATGLVACNPSGEKAVCMCYEPLFSNECRHPDSAIEHAFFRSIQQHEMAHISWSQTHPSNSICNQPDPLFGCFNLATIGILGRIPYCDSECAAHSAEYGSLVLAINYIPCNFVGADAKYYQDGISEILGEVIQDMNRYCSWTCYIW